MDLNTWMVNAIHREGGIPVNFPSVNLAHKAPTLSNTHSFDTCYCDVMLSWQPALLQYSSGHPLHGYEKDAIATVISSKVPIISVLGGFWICSVITVAFNRGTGRRRCYCAYRLASTDRWPLGVRCLSSLFVSLEQMCFNPVRVK